MATKRLADKSIVDSLAGGDSIVVVLANGNNRRILKPDLRTLLGVTPVTGTATLTNALEFPFNGSQQTVSLATAQDNTLYDVETEVVSSVGSVGEIEVSDRQVNGFKLAYTGGASSATIAWTVIPRAIDN